MGGNGGRWGEWGQRKGRKREEALYLQNFIMKNSNNNTK